MDDSLKPWQIHRKIIDWMMELPHNRRDYAPLWDAHRVGEQFHVPGIGAVEVIEHVDDNSRPGDFHAWSQPVWCVVRIDNRYFQAIGKNVSHVGVEWDYHQFREVTGVTRNIIEWRGKYDD